jgi:large subunit ribosomal protein L23
MDNAIKILKRPILSEKSSLQGEKTNKVYFEVAMVSTKPEIREAIERFFKVKVTSVNTIVMAGKPYATKTKYKKSAQWKKAIVTLKAGDKIEFFKGV